LQSFKDFDEPSSNFVRFFSEWPIYYNYESNRALEDKILHFMRKLVQKTVAFLYSSTATPYFVAFFIKDYATHAAAVKSFFLINTIKILLSIKLYKIPIMYSINHNICIHNLATLNSFDLSVQLFTIIIFFVVFRTQPKIIKL
jgi:hypothetical protein